MLLFRFSNYLYPGDCLGSLPWA